MKNRFPSNLFSACILAFAIVGAALIMSGHAPNDGRNFPAEESVRAQFISQFQAQTSGKQFFVRAEPHSVQRIEIDKVDFSAARSSFYIVYAIQWNPAATTVTGCSLVRDGFGHFTNAHDVTPFDDSDTPPRISIE